MAEEGPLPQSPSRGPQDMLGGPGGRGLRALCPPVLPGFIFPMAGQGILPIEKEGSRVHGVISRSILLQTSLPGLRDGNLFWHKAKRARRDLILNHISSSLEASATLSIRNHSFGSKVGPFNLPEYAVKIN